MIFDVLSWICSLIMLYAACTKRLDWVATWRVQIMLLLTLILIQLMAVHALLESSS